MLNPCAVFTPWGGGGLRSFVEQLKRFDDTFRIRTDGAVEFVPALTTPELRTAAVAGETQVAPPPSLSPIR